MIRQDSSANKAEVIKSLQHQIDAMQFTCEQNRIGGQTTPEHIAKLRSLINVPNGVVFVSKGFHFGENATLLRVEPVRGRVRVQVGSTWYIQRDCPGWFLMPVDGSAVNR